MPAGQEVATQVKGDRAVETHEGYTHPSSLQLYVRLLKGRKHLSVTTPLTSEDIQTIPSEPHQALGRLQAEWVRVREQIQTPVEVWARNVTETTVALLEHAGTKAEKVLRFAFNGWGVPMKDGTLQFQKDDIADGFGGDFYRLYCGIKPEEGMAHMAKKLIETFADVYKVDPQKGQSPRAERMEKAVLLVLESLKGWLTRFYGQDDIQEAFTACVKAELAVFTQRLTSANEAILKASLGETHVSVLQTISQLPPTDEEMPQEESQTVQSTDEASVLAEDRVVSPDGDEHAVPTHISAADLVNPAGLGEWYPFSTEEEESTAERTPEERLALLSEKRAQYYEVRSEILSVSSQLQEKQQEVFTIDGLAAKLKQGPQYLLLSIDKLKLAEDQSEAIDDIIRNSKFLDTSVDFANLTTAALQDIRHSTVEVFRRLRVASFKDVERILLGVDKKKLDEDEIALLIQRYVAVLPSGKLTPDSYAYWVKAMSVLPTFGDQLYYLISQDHRVKKLYDGVREENLQKELRALRGEVVEDGRKRTRRSTNWLEIKPEVTSFGPPPSLVRSAASFEERFSDE